MERSVLWRGGNQGKTPSYGTPGGSPPAREAAFPGPPGLPQRCGDPLGSVLLGASLSAPDGAMVVPGCLEEEGIWAVVVGDLRFFPVVNLPCLVAAQAGSVNKPGDSILCR